MTGRRRFSPQALAVLAALCAAPGAWHHGYGIARDTGLSSGTLYPILIRLADRGLVAARIEEILNELELARSHRKVVRAADGRYRAIGTW